MDLKTLLGSAYKDNMTIAEIDTALKDRKIVDLDGEKKYVDFEKHKKVVDELATLKESTKDFETMKGEYQTLKTAENNRVIGSKLLQWGVSDKFVDDVMYRVEKGKIVKDDDDKKFEGSVKAFLKENPQYAKSASTVRVVDTTKGGNNGGSGQSSHEDPQKAINSQINENLRGMFQPKQ